VDDISMNSVLKVVLSLTIDKTFMCLKVTDKKFTKKFNNNNITRIGRTRGVYRVLVGKPMGKGHLEDPGVDERIIIRSICRKWYWGGGWT
jgi:hypothetical protein